METSLVGTWVSEVVKNGTDISSYFVATLTFSTDGVVSTHYDCVDDGDISEGSQMQWSYGMNSNRKTLILKDDSSGKVSEEYYLTFSRGSFALEPCGKKNSFSRAQVFYKEGTAKAVQNLESLANFKTRYQSSLLSSVVGTWVSPAYQYAGPSIMIVTFYNDGTVSWGVGDSETDDTSYKWSFGSSQDQKTLQLTEYAGIQQYYITFSDKNFVLQHFGSGANGFFLLPDGQYNKQGTPEANECLNEYNNSRNN